MPLNLEKQIRGLIWNVADSNPEHKGEGGSVVVEVVITQNHHLKAEDGSRWQGQYKRDA